MRHFQCVGISLALFALTACSQSEVGSKGRPFTMYFVPSVDAQTITTNADTLAKFVQQKVSQKLYGKDTGFFVKTSVPTSYVAVVEAMGSGRADFAALTTFSYILAKDIKKYDVEAFLGVVRGKDEATYKGQIIAHKDSGIKTLEDLKGKKFAFTDPASTSGFILPSKLFKEKGITLGETMFAQKHDNVVTMVYQRQVDAGATFYSPPGTKTENGKTVEVIRDARSRVMTQFPDVESKVKIIGFTESVPNDPWVIRGQVDRDPARSAKIKDAIREALLEFASTEDGKKALDAMYSVTGLHVATDKDYAAVRDMILQANLDIEKSVK